MTHIFIWKTKCFKFYFKPYIQPCWNKSKSKSSRRFCCSRIPSSCSVDDGSKEKSEIMINSNLIYIWNKRFRSPKLPHQMLIDKNERQKKNCTSVCPMLGCPIYIQCSTFVTHAFLSFDDHTHTSTYGPRKTVEERTHTKAIQPNIFLEYVCKTYKYRFFGFKRKS